MAHVVDFQASSRRFQRRAEQRPVRGSAEVVLFPGVRYERWDDGAQATGLQLACVRDRIELPE